MIDQKPSDGLPLALLADDREERTGWLARLLGDAGYAVLRERVGRDVRERARTAQPDLIVVGADLPDIAGAELCRALRDDPRITSGTPIFVALSEPATHEQRLAALRAGAWECIAPPHDPDEIILKAESYVRAKRDADRMRAEGLLDPATGLYNRHGLARRARELGSHAFREHGALACIVLALDFDLAGPAVADDSGGAMQRTVRTLQAAARRSDAIGRLGPAEFALLAPATDAGGARRLAERLASSLQGAAADPAAPATPVVRVRCGYDAVANVGYAPIEPVDLLVRASAALRNGRSEAGAGWIRRFEQATGTPPPPPASSSSSPS